MERKDDWRGGILKAEGLDDSETIDTNLTLQDGTRKQRLGIRIISLADRYTPHQFFPVRTNTRRRDR